MAISPSRTAISAAKRAGSILLAAYGKPTRTLGVTRKAFGEPVSLVDLESNDAIIRELTRAFPSDDIVSEESKGLDAPRHGGSRASWIIDPLDGTTNFINHIPLFAVTIARVVEGTATLGVIFDPLHGDLFVAEKGKGARLNGKPIRVSTRDVTRGAMLFAGRGYRDRDLARHGKLIYALERQTPYFRRLGSAAHMLADVACGRADAVILTGSKPWDTVAGVLLVEEAGGRATDYQGKRWTQDSPDLAATNGAIHKPIIALTGVKK